MIMAVKTASQIMIFSKTEIQPKETQSCNIKKQSVLIYLWFCKKCSL